MSVADSSTAGDAADASAVPPDAARLEWLWSEYEAQLAEQKAWADEGMDIFPSAGIVVKTTLLAPPTRPSPQFPPLTPEQRGVRMKFFVNLCSDPALAMPHLEPDGQGGEHLRVPISAGPVVLDVEKDGTTPCLVTDLVLNPETVARAANDKDFRTFMAGFALQKVEQKFQCKLATEAHEIKWPKMKYKGSLPPPPQHIRRPKGAHIEPEDPHAAARAASAAADAALPSEDALEERRRAAAAARIEALRAMEERESGIVMGKASATASSAVGGIFTSNEAAEAAAQAEMEQSPVERRAAAMAAAVKPNAKIEVMKDEPAAAAPPSKPAAAAAPSSASRAAAASSVSAAAGAPASPSSPSSSLPEHSIFYLKSLSADATAVPAAEWDMGGSDEEAADLPLPAAVRLLVVLPLLTRGAAELEVLVTAESVSVRSSDECRAAGQHHYALHAAFPFLVDDASAECKFSKKTRTLTLTLPVTALKPLPDVELEPAALPAASAATATATLAVDWKAKLGLSNTTMFELVSES